MKPQEAPENLSAAKIAFEDDDAASTTKTKTVTTAKGEQPAGDEKSKSENPAKDDKQTTTKTGSEMEANSQTITETETKDPSGTLKEKVVKTETAWAKPKKSFHLDQILIGDIHSIVCDPDKHKPNPAKYVPGTLRKLDGCWYYVPYQYRPEFSDLCMAVVARGAAAAKEDAVAKAVEKNTEQLQQQTLLQTR